MAISFTLSPWQELSLGASWERPCLSPSQRASWLEVRSIPSCLEPMLWQVSEPGTSRWADLVGLTATGEVHSSH